MLQITTVFCIILLYLQKIGAKKMAILDEKEVLNFYLDELKNDKVRFLIGKESEKDKIKNLVAGLRDAEGMNDKVNTAKELWKVLFENSMSFIDSDKRGYDKLFDFFDEYVEFEELIFASDSFYRDHTLHCLWVYFLGEYVKKNESFKSFQKQINDDYFSIRKIQKAILDAGVEELIPTFFDQINKLVSVGEFDDSIYCVSALTHDLGYPLKKIEKINKSIKKILPHFAINSFDEFNFAYTTIQEQYIEKFIEFLSTAIGITIDLKRDDINFDDLFNEDDEGVNINKEAVQRLTEKQKKVIKKQANVKLRIMKKKSRIFAFSKDFEEYKHGIMSAFLLMKNVKSFSKLHFVETDNIEFADIDLADVIAKQKILTSMTCHTSDGYQIEKMNDVAEYLTFIDELEEFSRISRANQSREFISEFCTSDLYFKDDTFYIDFIFDNKNIVNLDPERAFKGRCERFLNLFDIPKMSENFKVRLRCIDKLKEKDKVYSLKIGKKFAKITIDGEEVNIPTYLKSNEVYSREEYEMIR